LGWLAAHKPAEVNALLPEGSSRPDGNSIDAAKAGTPLVRARPWIAGLALLLAAIITGVLVSGRLTSSPLLSSLTLGTTPWAATLDQETGRLFVVSRSPGSAAIAPTHGFASAGSYSFAVNGNHANIYNLASSRAPDTLSILDEGGRLVRTVPIVGEPGGVAVDPRRELLYITSDDEDTLSVRDARSAALIDTMSVGTRPNALAVSVSTGRLFVVNGGGGTVSVVDTRSEQLLRTVNVPTAVDGATAAVDSRIARVFVAGSGSLSVLDSRSGALLKTVTLESQSVQWSALPAQSGSVLLGTMTGMAVDERAGRVYILESGVLSIVDAGSGGVLRRMLVGSDATALALDARDGHLLLSRMGGADSSGSIEGAGSLEVLDPITGAVLRTISVGIAPIAVAVDERAGRVIVVDSGGDHSAADPLGWLPSGLRQRLPFVPAGRSGVRRDPARVLVLRLADLSH
jgi:DNA-binding beta-propeller fold protein YncE